MRSREGLRRSAGASSLFFGSPKINFTSLQNKGKYRVDFFKSLSRERVNESRIAAFLISLLVGASGLITPRAETLPLFDFGTFYKNRLVTFELKTDYRAGSASSRKVFIETENTRTGKPSGINYTLANRFVIYCPALKQIYSFPPAMMREFLPTCAECDFVKKAGDGNSAGYLAPLATLDRLPFVKVLPYDA